MERQPRFWNNASCSGFLLLPCSGVKSGPKAILARHRGCCEQSKRSEMASISAIHRNRTRVGGSTLDAIARRSEQAIDVEVHLRRQLQSRIHQSVFR
jgi:hypothetical protein